METETCITVTKIRYGMWVLPVNSFLHLNLDFSDIPNHIQLKTVGLLIDYSPKQHKGPVAFVSHQWTSWSTSEPSFDQFYILQRFFQQILAGDIKQVHSDIHSQLYFGKDTIDYDALLELTTKGYIWLDYFSVPQTSSDRAVESIPAYVEMSKFFIILSPPVRHVQSNKILDSSTWRRRGWFVAEAMSRLLARNTGPMIKLTSTEGKVELVPPYTTWQLQPGLGKFSCCDTNHRRPDKKKKTKMVKIPCDRKRLGIAVHELVNGYEETAVIALRQSTNQEREAKLKDLRWILSLRYIMLEGLESEDIAPNVRYVNENEKENEKETAAILNFFLQKYHFPTDKVNGSETDHRSGFTPLFYAALAGDFKVTRELLRRGADVNVYLKHGDRTRHLIRGFRPLHAAIMFGTTKVVQLLLDEGGADIMATDGIGYHAAQYACLSNKKKTLCLLLDREPRLMELKDPLFGQNTLFFSLVTESTEGSDCSMELLRRGASADEHTVDRFGYNALHMAAYSKVADGTVALDFLRSQIGVNIATRWSDYSLLAGLVVLLCRCLLLFGISHPFLIYLADYTVGRTPLMLAAYIGAVPATQSLLEAEANPLLQDAQGRTAQDYAHSTFCGGPHSAVIQILKEAEDKWRSTM